ncbi:nucleotidyl transferase [Streptomyces phage Peebs]|uniref:Nucleotidyltransferase n=1 Tax=Streptomyces phage Peebs TaxID=2023994 RepID=A0A222Z175_9CAUD|nr:nucleotidyl transferase [Streptomyces phage Peebs]ASR77804.1 nucleotidyltransferase [Streptomyces phage Peebs]
MTVLLRTIHGSHLYGLAHAGSDKDIYEVVATKQTKRKRNIKQTIVNGIDKTVVDLSTFMHMVDECVPQALEALWTPVPDVDEIHQFRTQYRVNRAKMKEVYIRTALNFAKHEDVKRKRHAIRLLLNLGEALEYGKFNPRLSTMDKFILRSSLGESGAYEDVFLGVLDEVQKWV